MGPLNLRSIEISYKKHLGVDEETAHKMSLMTKGYAYAYQVLGYLTFSSKKKNIDEELLDLYDQYLSSYVYEKIYYELSGIEKDILKCLEKEKEISIKDVCVKMNKDTKYISVYRDRLIKKGIIVSKTYGKIEIALPRFAKFLESMDY